MPTPRECSHLKSPENPSRTECGRKVKPGKTRLATDPFDCSCPTCKARLRSWAKNAQS